MSETRPSFPRRSVATDDRRLPPPSLVLVLTLVGFAVRAFHMNAQSLWFDEIGSANVATMPLVELLATNASRVEPTAWLSTAYYALVRTVLWLPHASPDWLLRATSVALGTATIPALAWTASAFLPATSALVVTAALAVSPFHVWYSQEVRPYVLLVLAVTLAMGAYYRALEHDRWPAWAATGVLTTLALYTHPIAIALPLICGIGLLAVAVSHPRRTLKGFATLAAVGLAFVPAILITARHGANHAADTRGVGLLDLPYSFYAYAVGFSLGPSTTELHNRTMATLLPHVPIVVVAAVVFGLLAIRGALATLRLQRLHAVVLVTWLILPIALAVFVATTTANPLNVRYTIVAFPAFVVVLGLGASDLHRPAIRALGILALAVCILSLAQLAFDPRYAKEDTRGLASLLRAEATPGDVVLVNADYMATAVSYYYDGPATVLGYPFVDDIPTLDLARATVDVARLTAGRPHVWLVATRTFHGEQNGLVERALGTSRAVDRSIDLPGIAVRRYTAPAPH